MSTSSRRSADRWPPPHHGLRPPSTHSQAHASTTAHSALRETDWSAGLRRSGGLLRTFDLLQRTHSHSLPRPKYKTGRYEGYMTASTSSSHPEHRETLEHLSAAAF